MDRRNAPTFRKIQQSSPIRRLDYAWPDDGQAELPLPDEAAPISAPTEHPRTRRWKRVIELIVASTIAAAMWFAMGYWLWTNIVGG